MSWKLERSHSNFGSGKGEFDYARGISISPTTGNIAVADINNKRIQILDRNLNYLYDWKICIKDSKLCPLDVHRVNSHSIISAVEGYIAIWECPDVTDYSNVEVKLSHSFGNDDIVFPRSVLSYKNKYVVTDVGKHRMTMHDVDGKLIQSLGGLGKDDATNFNWPYYTCLDDAGRIVVSDSHNRCVKFFDENFSYLGCFGKDVLTCCVGVCYSENHGGTFYVLDYDTHSLFEFSKDGKLISCIDDNMAFPGQSIRLDARDKLHVTMCRGLFVYSK